MNNRRMSGAIGMNQLAVLAHAAPSPDSDPRIAAKSARRHFDDRRKHIGLGV